MEQYVGLDVSPGMSSICMIGARRRIVQETKIAREPQKLVGWFQQLDVELTCLGLETDPLRERRFLDAGWIATNGLPNGRPHVSVVQYLLIGPIGGPASNPGEVRSAHEARTLSALAEF